MNLFENALNQHIQIFSNLKEQAEKVRQIGDCFVAALDRGNKILVCGNGGSAADAQHFAAELVGRFEKERRAFGAVALTTDTSIITAVGNDYSFEDIFARQVGGLGQKGDVLLGISTSGNSENVLRAVRKAKNMGLETVGLLGKDGGVLQDEVTLSVVVPHTVTARIQEAHIFILHIWAGMVDQALLV